MCDAIGKFLAGRTPGIHLNVQGKSQAAILAKRLSGVDLACVFSSPLERTVETAEPIAQDHELPLSVDNRLIEIDYGEWTGKSFDQLSEDKRWHVYNNAKETTRIPGGEYLFEMQTRMVSVVVDLNRRFDNSIIALVGHADPIKFAAGFFCGIPPYYMGRFTIDPASISIFSLTGHSPSLVTLNDRGTPGNTVFDLYPEKAASA
jgi:probable phosphoglycerate mutase